MKNGNIPFRFENMWLKVDRFNKLLRHGSSGIGLRCVYDRLYAHVKKNSNVEGWESHFNRLINALCQGQ